MTKYEDVYYSSADGLKLYARDYGVPIENLGTILCLPGLTRNSRDFEHIAEFLSSRYRVICAEQRGRGRSDYDTQWEHYEPMTYVSDMWLLLNELNVDQTILLGTSLGGLMSMIMAATQPDKIAAIALNDIGPEVDPTGVARIASYVGQGGDPETWADALTHTKAIGSDAFPDYTNDDWALLARKIFRETETGQLVYDYDPNIAKGFSGSDSPPPDLWPVFDMLKSKPLLCLRGELSDILSAKTLLDMQSRHPSMSSAIIPNRGHAPMLDEPAAIAAIEGFLETL